jgi:hypothetical protein
MPSDDALIAVKSSGHSVGRPKHPRVMAGAIEGDLFIGKKAQELRGLLKVGMIP